MTRDTVARDTPASTATSSRVGDEVRPPVVVMRLLSAVSTASLCGCGHRPGRSRPCPNRYLTPKCGADHAVRHARESVLTPFRRLRGPPPPADDSGGQMILRSRGKAALGTALAV